MDTTFLKAFSETHDCFNTAEKYFWIYVNSWKAEELDEFLEAFGSLDLSSLKLEKGKLSLELNYQFIEPFEYVKSTLIVTFNESEYTLYQDLSGKIFDDTLSFH